MNDVAISVNHISKAYRLYDKPKDRIKEAFGFGRQTYGKDYYALNDVSFDVNKGETVGIIGTNGSGKSTVLKIITGVLNPTGGDVTVNGRISALLELGAGFNMEYTGIENVYLNGTMIGFTREEIDQKMADILSFADIGEFINQPVKTYSSGMFVRLAFAVAINIEPEILIVDEALSVGDAFFQVKCYHKFEEFKAQGKTIVFVSHDLSSVNKYCDRVILLNKGEKLAEGNPKTMIDLYKKVMAGEEDLSEESDDQEASAEQHHESTDELPENTLWRAKMEENPYVSSYGNGAAEITDYCVLDHHNRITNVINAGEQFVIKMKVIFHQSVNEPVFAVTIRDKQGTEICGTNTMYEDVNTGTVKEGEARTVTFSQKQRLKGGEYLICLGCTGFSGGQFVVYHRLYEACVIRCLSDKDMVGYYDMESKIQIKS